MNVIGGLSQTIINYDSSVVSFHFKSRHQLNSRETQPKI